jgi:hypothetical protein
VASEVGTKTCQQTIEFYYVWKLSGHYRQWKKLYYGPDWARRQNEARDAAIAAAPAPGHASAAAAAAGAPSDAQAGDSGGGAGGAA